MRWTSSSLGRWRAALVGAVLLGLLPTLAPAQTDVTTGRISGMVTDTDATALPGVTVECRNTETGFVVVAVTDEGGFYRCLNLPTGTYTMTASLDGFATATAENIRLIISQAPTVNFDLPSASVSETITVTAEETPVVEITNTQAATTIQTEQLEGLPNAGPRLPQPGAADAADPARLGARQPGDLGPARHQHQRHRRRRRLQQRLLRRHGGRRRGARAAGDLAGVDQGVLGDHQRRLGRVRALRRRLRQRDHQERLEQPARLAVLQRPAQQLHRGLRQRPRAGRAGEGAVRRLDRRPDPPRPAVLFRLLRPAGPGGQHPDRLDGARPAGLRRRIRSSSPLPSTSRPGTAT